MSQHRCSPVARKLPIPELSPGVQYTASGDSLEDYPGWYVFRRGTDGRMYYYNVDYEITQWEHPRDKPVTQATDTQATTTKYPGGKSAPRESQKIKARPPTPATRKEQIVKSFLWVVGGTFCFMAFGGASVFGRISTYMDGGHRVNSLKPKPKGGVLTDQ